MMKNLIILAVALLITSTGVLAQTKAGKVDTTKHTTFYSCPNHPGVTNHEAGKCTICGMQLSVTTKEKMKAGQLKNYSCPAHIDVASHDPGKCPKCGKKLNLTSKEQMKADAVKFYTCPMHPSVSLDKDGVCAKCGTDLVEKKQKKG